jgi:uncharacterized protein (DUF58 family)
MAWLILILVLLAAAFGVLGAVLKAVAFLVITLLLTAVVLVAIAWYGTKRWMRRLEREHEAQVASRPPPRMATSDEALPPARDDRY